MVAAADESLHQTRFETGPSPPTVSVRNGVADGTNRVRMRIPSRGLDAGQTWDARIGHHGLGNCAALAQQGGGSRPRRARPAGADPSDRRGRLPSHGVRKPWPVRLRWSTSGHKFRL